MGAVGIVDAVARELMLFAGVGLLIGGIDELAVDACFAAIRLIRPRRRLTLATLPIAPPTRFAVFVPAWDEAAVIGPMLRTAAARFAGEDVRFYVGVYPNDAATAAAVTAVADPRIRLAPARRPGPTTKADNLNALWAAMVADGWAADAVVLHDAEDVVHPAELRTFAALLTGHDVVQLPVLPIVARGSVLLSGHYADEFSEMHSRALSVRAALGAGLPLAGVGCAIRTDRLRAIAATRGGDPFDASSLTEDYELGLLLAGSGARGCFARVRERADGQLVAVRAIFPGTLDAAVRQKARWITGIALAGWDRTGWSRGHGLGDHWMRLRDRRAPLAMLVLAAAYLSIFAWLIGAAAHWRSGTPPPAITPLVAWLLTINAWLLVWRLGMRMLFTGRAYGLRQALWSVPRFVVGNAVTLLAAPRALLLYSRLLRGASPHWDKTAHVFPDLAAAEV
ncbi:glycosyl transferase family protein [Sphingomonas sp.]|uniref:glycosyl transferase family protein n=1 Tax=Sphingomonas sp. TaxID=28214 RepID=UPI003CC58533